MKWYENISKMQWTCLGMFLLGKLMGIMTMILVMFAANGYGTRFLAGTFLIFYALLIFGCVGLSIFDWKKQVDKEISLA